ncbi:MAG: hypothetical protein CVV42_16360 [Candidatus Riflebacteria bacterium HGW-Riflebacteria-2]|jgi:hypothetical protein|nr:MAG: hypothetical protein CVV42_16360 [Candidatus Riflebacteria bacterium HGW-Riflebacteria-2]
MNRHIILFACLFMNAVALFAIDLPLGTSTAELGLKTLADVGENFGKGLPLGPAALRFVGDNLWVSDSLNKRLVEYDQDGKLLQYLAVASESHLYLEDFVRMSNGCFWLCDIDNAALLKIDVHGLIIRRFTTIGEKQLAWPIRIELLPSGNLLVLDLTLGELIEFTEDGSLVRADAVSGRSFLVEKDSVSYVVEKDNELYLAVRKLADNTVKLSQIPVGDVLDLELLAKTSSGECVVGYKAISNDVRAQMPYQLMRFTPDSDKPFATMQVGFPEAFLTRPLISKELGQDFLIRLAPAASGSGKVLRLSPVDLNFSLERSGG